MKLKIFVSASLIILCLFNFMIYQKEQIRQNGETVLLELAPMDPRSLMQGDYMRLNYKIDAGIAPTSDIPAHGRIVVAVGRDHIVSFQRFDDGTPLRDGERAVRYHHDYRTTVVPDSFMFQEGQADFYRHAKYGIFKFDGSDSYLLVGLADENRQPLIAPITLFNINASPARR